MVSYRPIVSVQIPEFSHIGFPEIHIDVQIRRNLFRLGCYCAAKLWYVNSQLCWRWKYTVRWCWCYGFSTTWTWPWNRQFMCRVSFDTSVIHLQSFRCSVKFLMNFLIISNWKIECWFQAVLLIHHFYSLLKGNSRKVSTVIIGDTMDQVNFNIILGEMTFQIIFDLKIECFFFLQKSL